MARISFEAVQNDTNTGGGNNDGIKIFSLKNDGDEAIVRIMHDSVEDFDIITTHPVKIGDKYRKVSCIRDPREPMDNCPLCKAGVKIQQRFYIHMIQYIVDNNGAVIAKPVVWERAAGQYATKIKTLIDEYGPLSDSIFKIRRNGKAGDMDTTYEILYGNPTIYRADLYPKDVNLFNGYTALGTKVLDRSFEDISQFMATGNFPLRDKTGTVVTPQVPVSTPTTPEPVVTMPYTAVPTPTYTTPPTVSAPATPVATPVPNVPVTPYRQVPQSEGVGTVPATPSRPTRYY